MYMLECLKKCSWCRGIANFKSCLDALKNVPDVGVWSVVEKDVDTFSQSSEITSGAIQTYKKRRVIKKPTKKELNSEEDGILQIGYSAVKEAAGNYPHTERLQHLFLVTAVL